MARRRPTSERDRAADAAAVARERRERAQRERERRRLELERSGRAPRPTRPVAPVATRERHEGLIAATSRIVAAIPTTIVGALRGFALEVVAVVAGSLRAVLRLVPGSGRILDAQRSVRARAQSIELPVLGGDAAGAAPVRGRGPRTEAEQRASERRRALLRRRLRLVLLIGLAVSMLLAWIYVPASDAFRIRHVEVTGSSAVGDLEARMRVDELLRGETVFTVDEDAVARKLEQLPFVRSASVERHLPGGLELRIVEYRPLALGYGDGRFWLVAHDGRILARASRKEWSGRIPLVTLRGDELRAGMRVGDEPALRLLAARSAGSTLALERVEAEAFRLVGTLEGGVEVRFGRADLLTQKVQVAELMTTIARRRDLDLVYIDVSVPSRPAICARSTAGCLLPRGRQEDEDDAETATKGEASATSASSGDAEGDDTA